MSRRSHTSMRPERGWPNPVSTLIISMAPRQPMAPATAPKTGKRRFQRIQARQARRLARQHRGELALQLVHGAIDERLALLYRYPVHEQALAEARGAAGDSVDLADQVIDVPLRDVLSDRDNFDGRIELAQTACSQLNAQGTDAVIGHEKLAIKIVWFQGAGVSQDEPANARSGELMR